MSLNSARNTTPEPYTDFNGQYINGVWRDGQRGTVMTDINPFTQEIILEIAAANAKDLDEAYQTAAKAQIAWANTIPAERAGIISRAAAIMEARHDEIIDWLVRETGGTRLKAEIELQFTRAFTLEAASYPYRVQGKILPNDVPGKESRVYQCPLGVIGVISPWNFPMVLSTRSVAPALALGNAVVLKPAPDTPVCGGLLLAKIYEEAGLPPGLLNIVNGEIKDIGDAFTLHPVPRLISFTGSTKTGRQIAVLAATGTKIKRVSLELGGNAPLVVLDDADVDLAVRAAVFGRFLHQGQICMSSNRIILDAKIHDDFVEQFAAQVATLKYGDPNDPDTVIGPVINSRQLSGILNNIKHARDEGATQILGGDPEGLVLPPHIFLNVTSNMKIAQNELFGPVATIIKVRDDAEALRVANDTEYGLSSAVFTRDESRGLQFAMSMQAGMTHINDMTINDMPNSPFGGEKNSGMGRSGGEWIIHELTTTHWITVQRTPRIYPF